MKASVVIPNYNGEKYIETCLDSLLAMQFRDYELIIIDNASTDGSLEMIRGRKEPMVLIENTKNLGFAAAVNQGIRKAQGEYVALLNNDVEVDDNWLGNLCKAMSRRKNTFAVSSKMLRYYERDIIDDAGDGYNIFGWAFKIGDGLPKDRYDNFREVFSACGGAAIYNRRMLNHIGLFDESFFAYMEDVDISFRARLKGYRIFYDPKSIVFHIGSATSGSKYNEFKIRLASRNNVFVIWKNMPLPLLIINLPFIIIGELIKIAFFVRSGYSGTYVINKLAALRMLKEHTRIRKAPAAHLLKMEVLMLKHTFEYKVYFLNRLINKLRPSLK